MPSTCLLGPTTPSRQSSPATAGPLTGRAGSCASSTSTRVSPRRWRSARGLRAFPLRAALSSADGHGPLVGPLLRRSPTRGYHLRSTNRTDHKPDTAREIEMRGRFSFRQSVGEMQQEGVGRSVLVGVAVVVVASLFGLFGLTAIFGGLADPLSGLIWLALAVACCLCALFPARGITRGRLRTNYARVSGDSHDWSERATPGTGRLARRGGVHRAGPGHPSSTLGRGFRCRVPRRFSWKR